MNLDVLVIGLLIIIGMVWIIGNVATASLGLDHHGQLLRHGLVTDAEVVDRYIQQPFGKRGFFVRYRFYAGMFRVDETTHYRTQQVSANFYNSLKDGDQVQVVYLPTNPNISELASGSGYDSFQKKKNGAHYSP